MISLMPASSPGFRIVGGEALHYLELEPADDGWPCVTMIDALCNVVHEAPEGCAGVVEYPERKQGARLLYCTPHCENVAGLVRRRRRVEEEQRHRRAEDGDEILIALWRQESDLLAGDFYTPSLTGSQREAVFRAKGRSCLECGAPATDVDHIRGVGAGDDLNNLQPLCRRCHLHKTATDGGMFIPPPVSAASESRRRLRAALPRSVWTRATKSGIPLFVVDGEAALRHYAAYLCRVYERRPRLCDEHVSWPNVWRQIASERRSEIA